MREYSTPLTTTIPTSGNLTDPVVKNAHEAPRAVAFSRPGDSGAWEEVTTTQFLTEVSAVAKGLIAAGVDVGDRVALLARTRYEWTLFDYAIWFAGGVTVPIYETSSAEQIGWILQDSGAKAIVAETSAHVDRVEEARGLAEITDLTHVWTIEADAPGVVEALGSEVSDDLLEERRSTATPLDVCTLIYTSGTTGRPKGCMLTHGNFMFELGVAVDELHQMFEPEDAATLLFLPLAHVFARIIQIGCINSRTRLGHSADIKNLVADLGVFRPTFILAVPRVFEKVFNTASQNAAADGKGAIFNRAADVAIAWSRATESGRVSFRLKAEHALFNKLVYGKLRAALGGQCQFAISGGAPLGERLGHFYRGIGLNILEGYGPPQTTAALCVNTLRSPKIGTGGPPFQGTAVRVADDGELLFKGGQVMSGYWNNEEATAQVLEPGGWFHTGDVGEIDDEGFVRITGRKKEIIVTAGGKNVAPAVLEDRLRGHLLIDQCLVVGDGQPFIGALVTIDRETLPTWAELNGKSGSFEELLEAQADAANL